MHIHAERKLNILSLTINNVCNLKCEHCYLNVAGTGIISAETIDKVFEDPPAKVAIVGMELLHDPRSATLVREIVRRGRATETFVSMITNGLGLKYLRDLAREELPDLIDISLDGGPTHYRNFRGDGRDLFPHINEGAARLRAEHPDLSINILHTLFAENTKNEIIKDMIEGAKMVAPHGEILFSPYIPPMIEKDQRQSTSHMPAIDSVLQILRDTPAFMQEERARFFAGPYNAESFGLSIEELVDLCNAIGIGPKSRVDTDIPHMYGGLRVGYDGRALRPDYSIHTSLYKQYGVPIQGRRLTDIYREFQALPSAAEALRLV